MSNLLKFMKADTHYHNTKEQVAAELSQAQPTLGELCCNCRVVTMVIVKGRCKTVERNLNEM